MSKGLGRIQRECLRVIESYNVAGIEPTTFNIVADVYEIKRDQQGNRMGSDAQHTAVKRALGSLRRAGLVTGKQDMGRAQRLDDGSYNGRAERCSLWSIVRPNPV